MIAISICPYYDDTKCTYQMDIFHLESKAIGLPDGLYATTTILGHPGLPAYRHYCRTC